MCGVPGVAGLAVCLLLWAAAPAAVARQDDAVLMHVWYILNEWPETPDGRGLLPTAISEAQIATQHAGLAGSADSLEQMQVHAHHVLHAVDPGRMPDGPGLGYGVRRASEALAEQMRLAGEGEDASDNIRSHATEVALLAGNTLMRVDEMVALVGAIDAAGSAAEAAPLTERLYVLARQLTSGADANGDGEIGAGEREGGLSHIEASISAMLSGEGLR